MDKRLAPRVRFWVKDVHKVEYYMGAFVALRPTSDAGALAELLSRGQHEFCGELAAKDSTRTSSL